MFKPKIKEKWRKEAIINIKTLLEVTENPKGCFQNKEKLINIKIYRGYLTISTSFVFTKKGKKEASNFIKRECYL